MEMRSANRPKKCSPRCAVWLLSLAIPVGGTAFGQQVTPEDLNREARAEERLRRQKEAEEQVTRAKTEAFLAEARGVAVTLASLESTSKGLFDRVAALLGDDDGKRLAQHKSSFMGILDMQQRPPVSIEDILARKRGVDTLVTGLESELKRTSVGYVPPESQEHKLVTDEIWASERLGKVIALQGWLDHALSSAPQVDLKKARTLQQVLDGYVALEHDRYLRALSDAEEDARDEKTRIIRENARIATLERTRAAAERRLADALAEIETMKIEQKSTERRRKAKERERQVSEEIRYNDLLAELERERKDADVRREAQDKEAEIERNRVKKAAERKVLREKAQSKEVRAVLYPFFDTGYWQPGFTRKRRGTERTVISLSALKEYGALQPGPRGLEKLLECGNARVGGRASPDKERAKWGFKGKLKNLSTEDYEQLLKAQQYLIELGDVLVEVELLTP